MQASVKIDREKYIGGSDVPIIMNLSPYKTRFHLLLEKAGLRTDNFTGNVLTEYGNAMEPKIRDYINDQMGVNLREKCGPYVEGKHVQEAADGEPIGERVHTDGENNVSVLEVKTTAEIHESVNDYKFYLVQLLYNMIKAEKIGGLLAVYERPEDLSEEFDPKRLHTYPISLLEYDDLVKEIKKAVERFKADLARVKANPFISEEELAPTEIPDIVDEIIAYENQLKSLKALEAKIEARKESLKTVMVAVGVTAWTTPNGYKITREDDKITITPPTVIHADIATSKDYAAIGNEVLRGFKSAIGEEGPDVKN